MYDLCEDYESAVWVGTDVGLFALRDEIWSPPGHFWLTVDRNIYQEAVDGKLECRHIDREGRLWIGGVTGLTQVRKERAFTFSPTHGLPETSILSIQSDHLGFLWLTGSDGIYRLSIRELDEVVDGNRNLARVSYVDSIQIPEGSYSDGTENRPGIVGWGAPLKNS